MSAPQSTRSAKAISLSPSALNLFRDCQRCFWLDKVKNIKRPRGIFPSLPSGMDRVIKDYFDRYRVSGQLPPEFRGGTFEGVKPYADQIQLDLWREWRTGPRWQDADGSSLFGAIDDLLESGDGFIPFDYKTKGSPTSAEDAQKYYQQQLDCYSLLLQASGLKQAGYGFLLYFSPKNVRESGWVLFGLQAIRIQLDPARAIATFREAVTLIKNPAAPEGACEYCQWHRSRAACGI